MNCNCNNSTLMCKAYNFKLHTNVKKLFQYKMKSTHVKFTRCHGMRCVFR